jgi:hypothetical protein
MGDIKLSGPSIFLKRNGNIIQSAEVKIPEEFTIDRLILNPDEETITYLSKGDPELLKGESITTSINAKDPYDVEKDQTIHPRGSIFSNNTLPAYTGTNVHERMSVNTEALEDLHFLVELSSVINIWDIRQVDLLNNLIEQGQNSKALIISGHGGTTEGRLTVGDRYLPPDGNNVDIEDILSNFEKHLPEGTNPNYDLIIISACNSSSTKIAQRVVDELCQVLRNVNHLPRFLKRDFVNFSGVV